MRNAQNPERFVRQALYVVCSTIKRFLAYTHFVYMHYSYQSALSHKNTIQGRFKMLPHARKLPNLPYGP